MDSGHHWTLTHNRYVARPSLAIPRSATWLNLSGCTSLNSPLKCCLLQEPFPDPPTWMCLSLHGCPQPLVLSHSSWYQKILLNWCHSYPLPVKGGPWSHDFHCMYMWMSSRAGLISWFSIVTIVIYWALLTCRHANKQLIGMISIS